MKKTLLTALLATALALPACAQFEQGTNYLNTSLSGIDLSYSHNSQWGLGINAEAGHFIVDEWMLKAGLGYNFQHSKGMKNTNNFSVSAGARYYIRQNGLNLGASLMYEHMSLSDFNSIALCPEVGYTFFVNKYLTIEPSVYYNMSLNKFSDCSKVGLRIGIGYYYKPKSKNNPIMAQ